MIYYVYAIKSLIDGRIYVGLSHDVLTRLKNHNTKRVTSTKNYTPWKIIYIKKVGTRIQARKEEKRLKSGYGKEFLRNLDNKMPITDS